MENLIGKKVNVYFNLHSKLWSIKHKGRVVGHAKHLTLRPMKFHISETGRLRVVEKKQRAVHAWITGIIIDFKDKNTDKNPISYNPYFLGSFYTVKNKKPYMNLEKNLFFNHKTKKVHILD